MSCGTQVGAKEWFLRSNKGIIALRQAEYQMPWPTDHKPMRTRWVTFHEQKWVRSRERRGRYHAAIENRLAVTRAIVNAIQAHDRAAKIEADGTRDPRHLR